MRGVGKSFSFTAAFGTDTTVALAATDPSRASYIGTFLRSGKAHCNLGEVDFGLYLSKFDTLGGFASAHSSTPNRDVAASIKNYRDELDPLVSNRRKGWHKRPIRSHCLAVFEEYNALDFESFTGLINSFLGYDENAWSGIAPGEQPDGTASAFAQRVITGLAAERYFESVHADLPEFKGYLLENTRRYGCGYDFRLRSEPNHKDFLAVEVKGLRDQTGGVSLTPKEYDGGVSESV